MSKTSSDIRQAFLDYFGRHGHEIVDSGPLVPPNDPSLMFANAGMVQFKDVFTGREQRNYTRATTSQKCIRISGKHNDLEAVGPSPRHHTFFEMLGNFSFGDYFKEEAIVFAWEFLTKDLALDTRRMVVTYFEGDDEVPVDAAARDIWKKVTGWGDDRIVGMSRKDNFWQMGDTGPCGPSSEIYYRHGDDPRHDTFSDDQNADGQGWMEIWNLVFMQFERSKAEGGGFTMADLPAPSIDTGMGLERIAGVVQGQMNNYDVDLLRALVDKAAGHAGKKYAGSPSADDTSMRVIADHARTTAFMISEGILPGNQKREYVLRSVMRRAIRHGHKLGIDKPFLFDVALAVCDLMGGHYTQLKERRDLIASAAEQEEIRFRETIDKGLKIIEDKVASMGEGRRVLDGGEAYDLWSTHGFPRDLQEVIGREQGFTIDDAGWKAAEKAHKEGGGDAGPGNAAVDKAHHEAITRVPGERVVFTGYDRDADQGKVVALICDGDFVEQLGAGEAGEVIVDRTPFYGESGGQVGDAGVITGDAARFDVRDTRKPVAGLWVHVGAVAEGTIAVGDAVKLSVDVERREAIRRNHSATHLLHLALRNVLGPHAQQKGSVVGPDRLRFDFTHPSALTADEITRIEDQVNERLRLNAPVVTEVLTMDEARDRGAMMIFEEKYGAEVRMLTMADSVELCGGTHARATGEIGLFKIQSEGGVAAGVRRIQAVTGQGAVGYLRDVEAQLQKAAQVLKTTPADVAEKLAKVLGRERELEKQIAELQRKLATGGGGGGMEALLGQAKTHGDVKVLAIKTEVTDRGALRELAEQLRDKLGDAVVAVGSVHDDKAQLVLTVAKALTKRFRAGDLIKPVAAIVGGSGGGRPDMAQAGGTQPDKLDEALAALHAQFA